MRRRRHPPSVDGLWSWQDVAWFVGHDDPVSDAARKWVRRQVLEQGLPEAEREGCAPRFDPEAVAEWAERLPIGRWGWRDVARFLGHSAPNTEAGRKFVAYRIKRHGLPVAGRHLNRPVFDPAAVRRWHQRRQRRRRRRRTAVEVSCPLERAMRELRQRAEAKERRR